MRESGILHTASALVRACHPGPTIAVTATMSALALAAGRGRESVWVGLAVLAGQLSVGWSNDFLDRGRDRKAGRSVKPVATGKLAGRLVAVAAVTALAATVAFSFAGGWRAAIAHLIGVAAAWAYNVGVKRTRASPVPYAVAFGLLPAFVTLGLPGHPWPAWWAVLAGALLGTAAHFTNVIPDISADLATGVRGLPHRLGARRSRFTAAGLLIAASMLLIAVPGSSRLLADLAHLVGVALVLAALTGGAVLIAIAGTSERGSGPRYLFGVTVAIAVADVVLLIARGASIA